MDAPALFDVHELRAEAAGLVGPTEAGLRAALEAAQAPAEDGRLTVLDAGLVGSALVGAQALDAAARQVRRDPKAGYLVAALLTPFREVCQAAGLPEPRESAGDTTPSGSGAPDWGSVLGPS